MSRNADRQLEIKIDRNDYDESLLVEVRIPLHMPYLSEQMEFERHYGEMTIEGKHYTYVKRKIENGELVLKCLPNSSRERILAAGNDFFKLANGLDQPGKKQDNGLNLAKNFWSEYDGKDNDVSLCLIEDLIRKKYSRLSVALPEAYLPPQNQPPESGIA